MGPDWCKRWGSNPLAPQSPGFTDRCHTFTAALAKWRKRQESNPLVPGSLTLTGFQDQRPTVEHRRRGDAAGGQPLTVRPHRNGNTQQFFLLLGVAACFCCALDQRMAKSRCICVSYVCWPFTFHLAKEKRSILCTLSARFLSVRTLGHLALLRTNGHLACLEGLGP